MGNPKQKTRALHAQGVLMIDSALLKDSDVAKRESPVTRLAPLSVVLILLFVQLC